MGQNNSVLFTLQLDSLQLIIDQSSSKVKKAKAFQQLGKFYEQNRQPRLAIANFNRCIQLINAESNPELYATANLDIARVFQASILFKPDSALIHNEIARPLLTSLSPQLQLEYLKNMLSSHYALYQFEEAMAYCLECITLAKEVDNSNMLRFCYSRMAAFSSIYLNDKEKVFEYANLALQSAIEESNPGTISYYYLMAAYDYSNARAFEKTFSLLDSCEKYIEISHNNDLRLDLHTVRGETYMDFGDYEKAEFNYRKAWRIAKDRNVITRQMQMPMNLGELALRQKDYTKAIHFSNLALAVAPNKLTLYELDNVNRQLYEAYRGKKRFSKCLALF